jgi:predicted RNA-binding Zn-ribbon protein involved in translation (DUF1610 family)
MVDLRIKNDSSFDTCSIDFEENKNYKKIIIFGNENIKNKLNGVLAEIKAEIAEEKRLQAEAEAERERIEAEAKAEKKRKRELRESIDFDLEEYYDFDCPKCGETLSFMLWQIEEDSNVVCPMCECKFEISIEGI